MLRAGFALLIAGLSGCSDEKDGGDCTYTAYPGMCEGTGSGQFTFTGTVGGAAVTFTGNTLSSGQTLDSGDQKACTLSYIATGTCSPCQFDIGTCGAEATAGQRCVLGATDNTQGSPHRHASNCLAC